MQKVISLSSDTPSHEVIVIGSGPAGVAAALQLRGVRVLMLDVGHDPPAKHTLDRNFYQIKRRPTPHYQDLIGPRFESLESVIGEYRSPKIKAPLQEFVTRDSDRFFRVISETFRAERSYARGGLANAWGAQLYRFTDAELASFPFAPAELAPFYRELTDRIGICGREDDLSEYYGDTEGLLPAHRLTPIGRHLLQRYEKRRDFFQQRGIRIGFPRLGMATTEFRGRKASQYENLEFFQPRPAHIYTPSQTLDELIRDKDIDYESGVFAERFRETEDGVEVSASTLQDGGHRKYRARRLVVAAGALGSARLVLRSSEEHREPLSILDNLLSYVPLVCPWFVGAAHSEDSIYTQVNLMYAREGGEPVMGTFYALVGVLSSDLIFDIPLTIGDSLAVSKFLLPAMLVLHLWYPAKPSPQNRLWLDTEENLRIDYDSSLGGEVERSIISTLRRAGYFGLNKFCRFPAPGNSFHYAGTLPMREVPRTRFETFADGRLAGTRGVYIADASTFPTLPSKNLSLTIMANAMRISVGLRHGMEVG